MDSEVEMEEEIEVEGKEPQVGLEQGQQTDPMLM